MGSSSSAAGIAMIVLGVLVVSEIITQVTGSVIHWPFVLLGIVVGLMAARSVR
jgi:hypothetical protein